MEQTMPVEEYQNWIRYFNKRPIGWREDMRAAKLIEAQGVKAKRRDLFASLGIIEDEFKKTAPTSTSVTSLRGSAMFQNMMNSVGGDKLEILDGL